MGGITEFLAQDHDRLDALFVNARAKGDRIDRDSYESFRRGLLKHVGMEELILLPAARRLSGAAAPLAQRTRLDHAALTSLLIPTPTAEILWRRKSVRRKDGGRKLRNGTRSPMTQPQPVKSSALQLSGNSG
jgi:hypothetical protein